MYCKKCGKEIDDDSVFCSYCGVRQSAKLFGESQVNLNSSTETDIHPVKSKNADDPKPESNSQNVNISLSFKKPTFRDQNKTEAETKVDKYDKTYQKETEATVVAVAVLVIQIITYLIDPYQYADDPQIIVAIIALVNLIWRIIVTIWIVQISRRQNRNTTGWGIFAFILPNLALFIIGLLRKIYIPSLTVEQISDQLSGQDEKGSNSAIQKQQDNNPVESTDKIGGDNNEVKQPWIFPVIIFTVAFVIILSTVITIIDENSASDSKINWNNQGYNSSGSWYQTVDVIKNIIEKTYIESGFKYECEIDSYGIIRITSESGAKITGDIYNIQKVEMNEYQTEDGNYIYYVDLICKNSEMCWTNFSQKANYFRVISVHKAEMTNLTSALRHLQELTGTKSYR